MRGPFVVEGILQGGAGALVAVLLLWGMFAGVRMRYGQVIAEVLGGRKVLRKVIKQPDDLARLVRTGLPAGSVTAPSIASGSCSPTPR